MKEHTHLTSEQVQLLLDGTLSPEAIRLAVRFVLGGCAVCLQMVRLVVIGLDEPGVDSRREDPPAGM